MEQVFMIQSPTTQCPLEDKGHPSTSTTDLEDTQARKDTSNKMGTNPWEIDQAADTQIMVDHLAEEQQVPMTVTVSL